MTTRDRLETVLGKRLRLAMAKNGMTVEELSEITGISDTAIKKIRNGKTRDPHKPTIAKLAHALKIPVDSLGQYFNGHVFSAHEDDILSLKDDYGPSVEAALTIGPRRTLWLAYDTISEKRYAEDAVYARIIDREPNLSPAFLALRAQIVEHNNILKADPSLGKPFFDGPTFCLSRYHLDHSEDGHETKRLIVDFSKSRYANNVTAKSTSGANLRRRALQSFHFLDQPIEWLTSGVGVAVVVFCDGGKHFVVARRSEHERFRSREFDISVVEGINPVKDRRTPIASEIFIYDVTQRAVEAELGFRPDRSQICVIGFGVDLEYYQWNYIAYVESNLSYNEIRDAWQSAEEKFETMELRAISTDPYEAARFSAENPIWSSGLAALYFSLQKRSEHPTSVRQAFSKAFSEF